MFHFSEPGRVFQAENKEQTKKYETKTSADTKANDKTQKSSSAKTDDKTQTDADKKDGKAASGKGSFPQGGQQEELKIKKYKEEKRVEVEIGIVTDTQYEIKSGVEYGQVVKNTTQTSSSQNRGMGGMMGGGMMGGGMPAGMMGGNRSSGMGGSNRNMGASRNMGGR